MKALREIGIRKVFRFIFYIGWEAIFVLLPFPQLRAWWLRLFGAKIGDGTIVYQIKLHNLYHHGLSNLNIGKSCFLARDTLLDLSEKIVLHDNVCIGEGVILSTHLKIGYQGHPLQKYFPSKKAPVTINSGTFIGVGAIILAGSTIGKCCFISAGTTVSGKIADWSLVYAHTAEKHIPIRNIKTV